jgi:predicted chitinase
MQLVQLSTITSATSVSGLPEPQLRELQTALSALGYPVGTVDGMWGPRTRNAWGEFKAETGTGQPDMIGPASVQQLQARLQRLGDHDFSTEAGTKTAIRAECIRQGIALPTQIAYVLATTDHETAHTFQPVREAFWLSEEWRRENLRYYPYYGRGYVQLTWQNNYEKYGTILGIDLVNDPDLALQPPNALFILVHGFKTGTFTGRSITDFINANQTDFIGARRCINDSDKAVEIAALAQTYLASP